MPQRIVHTDLFGLLSLELGTPAQELRAALRRDAIQVFALEERLAKVGFQDLGLTLAEPVIDGRDGAVLLAAGMRLTPRFAKSLVARQLQDGDGAFGPIALAGDEPTLRHYRTKVRHYLDGLVRGVREAACRGTRLIHEAIRSTEDLKGIETVFGQLVDHLLSGEEALTTLLETMGTKSTQAIFERSIDAAFVAMAVRLRYGDLAGADGARDEVANVGLAALLQDLSLAADPDPHAAAVGHEERSAVTAGRLGASSPVQEMIRGHHRVRTPRGIPALRTGAGVSTGSRALVTVNVFLEMVERAGTGQNFETMKALSYLADEGFADARSVLVLCRVYLPRLKSYILEQAGRIGERCPSSGARPILWPISGDKVPTVYLCRNQDCPSRTGQVSRIAHGVPFQVDGIRVATIEPGDYFTCPPLTQDLRRLYEVVQAHIKKGT